MVVGPANPIKRLRERKYGKAISVFLGGVLLLTRWGQKETCNLRGFNPF